MVDESIHNNPVDPIEEIFVRLEDQVIDISHNMALLMASIANLLKLFGEFGGSNLETKS
jgi:hypothetical protein